MSSSAVSLTLAQEPIEVSARTFRLGHLPVLDGVRGLSILLVLIHHTNSTSLNFTFLPGGFLGVDIFFVLSGFLITSILVEEYETSGSISLRRFYIRRALRLLPAVVAALLFAGCLGVIIGFDELGLTPLRVASIAGYFTNWLVALNPPEPWILGHFWSLAVEEQFYLAWPLLLIGLMHSRLSRKAILMLVALLILASVVWMATLHAQGATLLRVYYGSDTRAHALMVGCLASLALHWGYIPSGWWRGKNLEALGTISLIVLLTGAFSISHINPVLWNGGFFALAMCAAVLILWLVMSDSGAVHDAFKHPVLVWFGKRSYGLYVWHWPVYFLSNEVRSALSVPIAIAVTVGIAAFSYRFIESPFLRLKSRYTSKVRSSPV